jgi:glycosyltransferase involved in cell wall biosynthesis
MDFAYFKNKYEKKKVVENNNQVASNPLVSVCILSYNHENYIKQCLDSILEQQTNFDFEILLGEDASTDGTRKICIEYAAKYPKKIRLFLHHRENNIAIGRQPTGRFNFLYNLFSAHGKYIALCDGDDYWTDPLKLQKQVDFLEANKEHVLCFHNIQILEPDGKLVEDYITNVPEHYETQETLAKLGNYIHTPSVLFRNIIEEYPAEFQDSPLGDYFLYMTLVTHGKIQHLNESMAVYRHGVGFWSGHNVLFRRLKTAETFAVLATVFQDNLVVKDILLGRIQSFIRRHAEELKPEDLESLCYSALVNVAIFDTMLNLHQKWSTPSLAEFPFNSIVKHLLNRIFKRASLILRTS